MTAVVPLHPAPDDPTQPGASGAGPVVPGGARRRRPLPAALRRPGGLLGALWLLIVLVLSFTAPIWRPYGVNDQDLAHRLELPSAAHWLGTDKLGRDLLSRLFSAGAEPLLSSALMVLVAFAVGIPLALLAAERGRLTEKAVSRSTEVLLALPSTIILLAVIGVIGSQTYLVMIVLGILISAAVYRIMLGVAQSVRQRLYVDAARVNGLGSLRVNAVHVLPAMGTVIAVQAAQLFGIGLLIVSGLAFLGFGPAEPQPSWGVMINDASGHVYDDPWLMIPSGLVLAITVVAANALADAIAGPREAEALRVKRRRRPAFAPIIPADASAVLEVRDLTVSVDDGPALVTGVSFALQPGRVLGLVGESGCGKTMTARSLLGLLPDGVAVSGGAILWRGRDLVGLTERELNGIRGREIAMISQEPMVALDPVFSIAYQLIGPIRRFRNVNRKRAREIAADLLRQVGIVDTERVLGSYAHQLSGGMAQRVAIALALTGEPKLLVADEPTTALDVTVQAEILSLLRALVHDTGLAMVLVSHDLGVVADICDDMAVMYAGEVVESGSTPEALGDPEHPYTMALLGANPHLPEGEPVPLRLASIPGTVPSPGSWPQGCRFASRCQFAQERCRTPFEPAPAHGGGIVRCIRVQELAHASASWTAVEPGAEIAVVDIAAVVDTAGSETA